MSTIQSNRDPGKRVSRNLTRLLVASANDSKSTPGLPRCTPSF